MESTGGEKSLFSGLNCVGPREILFVRIHKLIHSDVTNTIIGLILPMRAGLQGLARQGLESMAELD